MRGTTIHRGGIYRPQGHRGEPHNTNFGRLALHFAVENDTHVRVRKKIANETINNQNENIKWTDLSDEELQELSIRPAE